MQSDKLTVFDAEPDSFAFCLWRNVAIAVWWLQATGPAVERLSEFSRTLLKEFPDGFSNIHIIKEGALLPDSDGRNGLMSLMKRYEGELVSTAVVVGGEGFWASALRGAVTGLWLAASTPIDMRVVGSFEEVATWMLPKHAQRTGTQLDSAELLRVMRQADDRELTKVSTPRSA